MVWRRNTNPLRWVFDSQAQLNRGPMCDILNRFRDYFGQRGGDQVPGNIGAGRQLSHLCREALAEPEPVLFDYYADWHSRADRTPVIIAIRLVELGMWEAAWNVT